MAIGLSTYPRDGGTNAMHRRLVVMNNEKADTKDEAQHPWRSGLLLVRWSLRAPPLQWAAHAYTGETRTAGGESKQGR
jgi:hypothetical protein